MFTDSLLIHLGCDRKAGGHMLLKAEGTTRQKEIDRQVREHNEKVEIKNHEYHKKKIMCSVGYTGKWEIFGLTCCTKPKRLANILVWFGRIIAIKISRLNSCKIPESQPVYPTEHGRITFFLFLSASA